MQNNHATSLLIVSSLIAVMILSTGKSNKNILISTLLGITVSSVFAFYIHGKVKKRRNRENISDGELKEIDPTLRIQFEKSSTIAKSELKSLPGNDQLMLYGLYKQAKFGNAINTPAPSKLNIVASAKYVAWTKFHSMPRDFAMLKYVEVVHHLVASTANGTRLGANVNRGGLFGMQQDDNADIIYDDDSGEEIDFFSDDDDNDNEKGEPSLSFGAQPSTLNHLAEDMIDVKSNLLHAATLNNPERIKECISNGADVDERDENGQSALHLAADKGFEACVNVLLEAGADVNAADISGISVLEAAVIGGKLDVIKILVKAGADPDQEDMDGETPRSCAEDDDDVEIQLFLRNAPRVERGQ